MKKIVFFLIGFFAVSFQSKAQDNFGYYGRKSYVSVTSNMYFPIIYNLLSDNGAKVSPSGNSLLPANDWFGFAVRSSIGHTLESNFGVALDVGYERFTLNNDEILYRIDGVKKTNESLKVNSLLIMPKFEIGGKNGLLPNGLVHQIGFGCTINSVVKKNYLVDHGTYTTGGPNGNASDQEQLFEDYSLDGSITLFQIMYGLKMRTPITKSLMLDYGFRYTLDFPITQSDLSPIVRSEIFGYQFVNLISFDLGLTMPF